MGVSTSRLQLFKPDEDEFVDVATQIDDNLDKIDLNMGAQNVTSSTHPSTGIYTGKLIYETDTGDVLIWNGVAWVVLSHIGAWKTYTPIWTTTGSTPSIGNGSLLGRYFQLGRTITVQISLTIGSTTNPGVAGAAWIFTLPVSPLSSGFNIMSLNAFAQHNSGAEIHLGKSIIQAGTINLIRSYFPATSTGTVGFTTATFPFTWANTDILSISGTYECNAD